MGRKELIYMEPCGPENWTSPGLFRKECNAGLLQVLSSWGYRSTDKMGELEETFSVKGLNSFKVT